MNRVAIALFALVSVALAVPVEEKPHIRILKQSVEEPQPDGNYAYSYETENGIKVEESVVVSDPEEDIKLISGSYTYTAPDGTPIAVQYIADGEGFQPSGEHLPVPPPVPEQIQRGLEYIAAHPEENKESS